MVKINFRKHPKKYTLTLHTPPLSLPLCVHSLTRHIYCSEVMAQPFPQADRWDGCPSLHRLSLSLSLCICLSVSVLVLRFLIFSWWVYFCVCLLRFRLVAAITGGNGKIQCFKIPISIQPWWNFFFISVDSAFFILVFHRSFFFEILFRLLRNWFKKRE